MNFLKKNNENQNINKNVLSKTLSLFITLIISTTLSFAQKTKGQDITVTIENIENSRGHVIIGLHTTDTFMKADGLQEEVAKVKDGKVIVTFKNVAPGNYALLALHDENDNKRMDFEPSGMPLESFGLSNNPSLMGPPAFSDGKFEVATENIELTIKF
jgi:uncharacterized protein (DUF2141 family)